MLRMVLLLTCLAYACIGYGQTSPGQDGSSEPSVAASIKDKAAETSVTIHPNPSEQYLRVTIKGSGTKGKVLVYDILGKLLLDGEQFDLLAGKATWTHDVSDWRGGTYVVRVLEDESVIKTLRFVKN